MIPLSEQIMKSIDDMLTANGIRRIDLAAELGVSKARVSAMFSEGSNLTLKTVDRVHDAISAILMRRPPKPLTLGEEPPTCDEP